MASPGRAAPVGRVFTPAVLLPRLLAAPAHALRLESYDRLDCPGASGTARERLEVFDLSGRRVAPLADREFAPGRHDLLWDGRGDSGGALDSGVYFFVRLITRGLAPQAVRLAVVR